MKTLNTTKSVDGYFGKLKTILFHPKKFSDQITNETGWLTAFEFVYRLIFLSAGIGIVLDLIFRHSEANLYYSLIDSIKTIAINFSSELLFMPVIYFAIKIFGGKGRISDVARVAFYSMTPTLVLTGFFVILHTQNTSWILAISLINFIANIYGLYVWFMWSEKVNQISILKLFGAIILSTIVVSIIASIFFGITAMVIMVSGIDPTTLFSLF